MLNRRIVTLNDASMPIRRRPSEQATQISSSAHAID
jgi:hypothetical protein